MAGLRTKEIIMAELEEAVNNYNELYQSGRAGETGELDKNITSLKNEYTSFVRNECFSRLCREENPMLAAVTELTYETIRVFDTKVEDDKGYKTIPVRKIETVTREIDLLKLNNYAKNANSHGIGADENWQYYIEKLNFLMTAKVVCDLNEKKEEKKKIKLQELNDSYIISKTAMEIDMGKTPASKTALLKQLNIVVKAMLGEEFKAKSHDVNYILDVYSKGGRGKNALKVMCSNHKTMRQIITRVLHSIVTGADYDPDWKRKKRQQ